MLGKLMGLNMVGGNDRTDHPNRKPREEADERENVGGEKSQKFGELRFCLSV